METFENVKKVRFLEKRAFKKKINEQNKEIWKRKGRKVTTNLQKRRKERKEPKERKIVGYGKPILEMQVYAKKN